MAVFTKEASRKLLSNNEEFPKSPREIAANAIYSRKYRFVVDVIHRIEQKDKEDSQDNPTYRTYRELMWHNPLAERRLWLSDQELDEVRALFAPYADDPRVEWALKTFVAPRPSLWGYGAYTQHEPSHFVVLGYDCTIQTTKVFGAFSVIENAVCVATETEKNRSDQRGFSVCVLEYRGSALVAEYSSSGELQAQFATT